MRRINKVSACFFGNTYYMSKPKASLYFCFGLPSLSMVYFLQSTVDYRGFLEQFSGSQEAFGTTFRVIGGYRKAGTSFLKKVTVLE
jgi:hypothetical protein